LKGANACLTNHGAGGLQALAEAVAVLREGDVDRAVVVSHSAPVEPQAVLYYTTAGLLAGDALRPFDAARGGTILGEGAAALVVESEESARANGARVLGEVLGCGSATEGEGLLTMREDGDGPFRAMVAALEDAGVTADRIGLVVARGDGGRLADAAEARAMRRLFGRDPPPITAWKWACGNLMDPAGLLEALLALVAIARGQAPGIATLERLDAECEGLPIAREARAPRSDLALIHAGGFGGVQAAVVLRGIPGGWT
jgi:3-oxoacyl-[acyl-carrier-protein] synthase-1